MLEVLAGFEGLSSDLRGFGEAGWRGGLEGAVADGEADITVACEVYVYLYIWICSVAIALSDGFRFAYVSIM